MSAKSLASKVLPLPILGRIAYWRQYWMVGEWELRELSRLLPTPGLGIDVGANVGYYSYALRRLGNRVVSFEPDPAHRRRLETLLGKDTHIEAVALSSEPGSGVMRVPQAGGAYASLSNHAVPDEVVSSSYNVELRTLDSYNFRDVRFIKIDVEGHEEGVLAGAHQTLSRWKPVLLIEVEERHNPGGLGRIANLLAQYGYAGFFFYNREQYPLSNFRPETHQVEADINVGETNRRAIRYVNNFIFKAK